MRYILWYRLLYIMLWHSSIEAWVERRGDLSPDSLGWLFLVSQGSWVRSNVDLHGRTRRREEKSLGSAQLRKSKVFLLSTLILVSS